MSSKSGSDVRARRTRLLLSQALIELGAQNGVDTLDVNDLARTAGIGRSTFYAHFASKQDFLSRSFVTMLSAMENAAAAEAPDRTDLLPARHILAHVSEARAFAVKMLESSEFPAMLVAGERKLRAIAETNLQRLKPGWSGARRRETAIYVAGGFMGLVRWWMETGMQKSAEDMQRAFARLSDSALASSES